MDAKIDPPGIYDLSSLPIEEIQAYLKTKGLGTFNLSLDFHYYQNETPQEKESTLASKA